jgi:hypothetical protein
MSNFSVRIGHLGQPHREYPPLWSDLQVFTDLCAFGLFPKDTCDRLDLPTSPPNPARRISGMK